MRLYIVAGTIGTGITEVCTELRMEVFRRGYRAGRMVLGRPDRIFIDGNLTAEAVIQRVQEFMNSARAVPTEIIMSGTEITKHALAIRANWPDESRIIFVRKEDEAKSIDAGLRLLEHHIEYNESAFRELLTEQIATVNSSASSVGATWYNVDANDMFTFSDEALATTLNMTDQTITITPYVGEISADSVPRQLAIY
jgi:hypothetical protein